MQKFTPLILFLLGLLICAILGYSVWESGYLQSADNKSTQEQQVTEDISAQDKAAADKAAEEKAATDKAAANKAAEEKAAADKAAADKAAADQAATDKATADKAAVDKAAADQAAADKAAADKEAADAAAKKIEAIQNAMGFDVLRIEPTGGAVIAGRAPSAHTIELVDGLNQDSVLAQGTSTDVGEFALVMDKPLSEGKYAISINASDQSGQKYVSSEIALVEVFAASLNKTPVVILSKAGAATRILQGDESQGEETQVAQEDSTEQNEQSDENTNEEAATTEDNAAETPAIKETKPQPVNAVFIKAADVEGDKLIIAGTGPAEATLNIYLDDQLLGQTIIAPNKSYIFEKSQSLEAGRHTIRADRINTASNKVLGRAEVSLLHEPEVAAVEETPTTQAAGTEDATATDDAAATDGNATQESGSEDTSSTEQDQSGDQSQSTEQASTEGENSGEAKEEIKTGTTVIIRRGDSLWRVSRKNYGVGMKFTTIFDANKDQIKNPNLIYPGQVFTIPEAE